MDSDRKTMLKIGSNGDAGCKVSLTAAYFYHVWGKHSHLQYLYGQLPDFMSQQ